MKYNSNIDSEFKQTETKTGVKTTDWSSEDMNMIHYIRQLYGDTMSAKGLNLLDPIYANIFHYNKMQVKGQTDYPRVTRTYCFFTRPELNWSYENIQAIPFFKWMYAKPIGKMLMSCLTDPEYFINAPGALNGNTSLGYAAIQGIMSKFSIEAKKIDDEMEQGVGISLTDKQTTDTTNSVTSSKEDTENAAEENLNGISLEAVGDDTALDSLSKTVDELNIKTKYSNLNKAYVDTIKKLEGQVDEAERLAKSENIGLYQGKNIMRSFGHDGLSNVKNSQFRFNHTSPFIPLLGNTCTELTGARDLNIDSFEYEEDEFSGKQTVATGMDAIWGSGTFTSTHEDIAYGPVSYLFLLWEFYIHYVSRGYINTTMDHIRERILDYTCSCYTFVIGADGRTIERWGKFTGAYPISHPLSSQIEHHSTPDEAMLQKLSITWQYNRYEPMNPEIFTDFNFLSETEWLFKLKNWDDLYNRNATLATTSFSEAMNLDKNNISKNALYNAGRNPNIWNTVDEPGMSGQVPRAVINGSNIDLDFSHSDIMNNYWGGYPYINNGTDLIWVSPQWKEKQDSSNANTKAVLQQQTGTFDEETTAMISDVDVSNDPAVTKYISK